MGKYQNPPITLKAIIKSRNFSEWSNVNLEKIRDFLNQNYNAGISFKAKPGREYAVEQLKIFCNSPKGKSLNYDNAVTVLKKESTVKKKNDSSVKKSNASKVVSPFDFPMGKVDITDVLKTEKNTPRKRGRPAKRSNAYKAAHPEIVQPQKKKVSEAPIFSDKVKTLDDARKVLGQYKKRDSIFEKDIECLTEIVNEYINSNKIAKEYLSKKFEPTEISYDRFEKGINRHEEAFLKLIRESIDIILVTSRHNEKSMMLIEKNKKEAEKCAEKIQHLSLELVMSQSDSMDGDNVTGDISSLMEEMQELIDSVKNYE